MQGEKTPINVYLLARKEYLKLNFNVESGKGQQALEYKRIRELLQLGLERYWYPTPDNYELGLCKKEVNSGMK